MHTDRVRTTGIGSRAMEDWEVEKFLEKIDIGTLSYIGDEGWPDARMFNFVRCNGNYYFHSHKTRGEKLPFISSGQKACLSFFKASPDVGLMRYCQHNSVLLYGTVERIDNRPECEQELIECLKELCISAGTHFKAEPWKFNPIFRSCSFFRFVPNYVVGKITIFTSMAEMSYLELQHAKLQPHEKPIPPEAKDYHG